MGFFLTIVIAAIAAHLWAYPVSSAKALEFETGMYLGQRVLLAKGEIGHGDAQALRNLLRNDPRLQEVLFNSNGGLFAEGIELGETLRELGRVTRVPTNGICVSACVWAFLGGALRYVDQDAKVGVHMATLINSKKIIGYVKKVLADKTTASFDTRLRWIIAKVEKGAARVAADKAEHLVKMGVSLRLLAPGLDTNQWDLYWPPRAELRAYNIVNSD